MKLADLFIEFTLKGVAEFHAALDKAKDKLDKVKGQFNAIGSSVNTALNYASATILGFAAAGLHASQMGSVLAMQFERLSLTIAGLFRPEIEKLIGWIHQLVNWLNSLSQEQKRHVSYWLQAVIAMAAAAKIVPFLTAAIGGVIVAVALLTGELTILDVLTGGLLPLLGALVAVVAGLAIGTETGRTALGGLWEMLKGLWETISPLVDAVKELVSTFMELLEPILAIAKPILSIAASGIGVVFSVLGAALKVILAPLQIVLRIFERLLGLIQPLIDGINKFAKAITGAISSAVGWFTKLIDKGLELIGLGKKEEEKKAKAENRGPLLLKSGGFENLDATFQRIAAASVNLGTGKPVEEEQLDELRMIRENTTKDNGPPPRTPTTTRR